MKAKITRFHWAAYNTMHDDRHNDPFAEPISLWFNVVITITTVFLLVTGQ